MNDDLIIPSNPVVTLAFKAIWNGADSWTKSDFWGMREGLILSSSEMQRGGTIHVIPSNYGAINRGVLDDIDTDPSTRFAYTVTPDPDLATDVMLVCLHLLSSDTQVSISPRTFLEYKGLRLKGHWRRSFEAKVSDILRDLSYLNIAIHDLNLKGAKREQKVIKDKIFVIRKMTDDYWIIMRPKWFKIFMDSTNIKWFSRIPLSVLRLSHRKDRAVERIAKRLGCFILLHRWKLRRNQEMKWRVGMMIDSIGIATEFENVTRFRRYFIKAMRLLINLGVIYDVLTPPDFVDPDDRQPLRRWRDMRITFTLTDQEADEDERVVSIRRVCR